VNFSTGILVGGVYNQEGTSRTVALVIIGILYLALVLFVVTPIWKGAEHTDKENLLRSHLRAVEWIWWPGFLSQTLGQVLLYFYDWITLVIAVAIASILWRALVVPFWVSARLARAGIYFVKLKFLTGPGMALLPWLQGEHSKGIAALLWPAALTLLAVPTIALKLTKLGGRSTLGGVQTRFLRAIGVSVGELLLRERLRPFRDAYEQTMEELQEISRRHRLNEDRPPPHE
jgi:hypothetical protein